MILAETSMFCLTLISNIVILLVLVYYIITLSDLECDYLNAQECCDKLNYWMKPKYIAQILVTLLLLFHGFFLLFFLNLPLFAWMTYDYITIPQGNIGHYDPFEIHNRGQLKKHLRDIMCHICYSLIFFFIYLYCLILSALKGNPIPRQSDYDIVTRM